MRSKLAARRYAGYLGGAALLLALAAGCGGEEAPQQARDRGPASPGAASTPTPTATATPAATATPTATPFNLACAISPTCTPTPAASGPARTPTATATTATRTPASTATPRPTPSPSAGATPTLAQLRRALLTEGDLGTDWGEVGRRDLTGRPNPAVSAAFLEPFGDQSLTVELHDARNGTPENLALRLLTETAPQATAAAPLGYGTRGVRYRYTLVTDGARYHGELAAWQQDSVVIVMLIEGDRADVCLCDLARRQDDAVRAAFR